MERNTDRKRDEEKERKQGREISEMGKNRDGMKRDRGEDGSMGKSDRRTEKQND